MRFPGIITFVAALAACTCALADHDSAPATPPAILLYLEQEGWDQSSAETKSALAADFMRVFCGNPAMPAADLVDCLDRGGNTGSIFPRALACVAADPVRPAR